LLIAASWLAAASDSSAENFLLLYAGIDEIVMIDRDSISRSDARALAWVVRRLERTAPARGYTEIRERYAFDCTARTLGVIERRGGEDGPAPLLALAAPRSGREQALVAYACGG
jgi:hypothetical protein